MALTQIKAAALTADLIDETKLADNSIDSEHYNDGSIDTAHIADDQITNAKVNSSAAIAGSKISPDFGSQNVVSTGTSNALGTTTIKGGSNAAARLLLQNTTSVRTNYIGLSGDDDRIVIAADDAGEGSNSTIDFKVDGSERMRIDSDGRLLLNTTAVTNTNDQLTVKKPASGFGEVALTVDANTSTSSAANAFVYTKSKHSYWNGFAFQSSHGYIGALLGKRDSSGTTDQEIRLEIGGNGPNDSEEKTWTFQNDGDLSIDDGNLTLASGHGIDFSATSGSGTSELLDDYEEGTYTISDASGNGITYTSNNTARYIKIGPLVYVQFDVTLTNCNNLTTQDSKFNLPFSFEHNYGSGAVGWTSLGKPAFLHIADSGAGLMDNDSNGSKHLVNSELQNVRFIGSFHYLTT